MGKVGGGRVIPGTERSPSVCTGTTLWLRVWVDGVVVLVAFPFRWTVGVRGVGEILVGIGQIELEECGGVVGERAGCEEGHVTDDMEGQGWVGVGVGGGAGV